MFCETEQCVHYVCRCGKITGVAYEILENENEILYPKCTMCVRVFLGMRPGVRWKRGRLVRKMD